MKTVKVMIYYDDMAYLVFEGDNPGLDDLQGELGDGLGDGVLHLDQVVGDELAEELAGDDQGDVLVDDGLDEALEPVHELVLAQREDLLEDAAVAVGEIAVRNAGSAGREGGELDAERGDLGTAATGGDAAAGRRRSVHFVSHGAISMNQVLLLTFNFA